MDFAFKLSFEKDAGYCSSDSCAMLLLVVDLGGQSLAQEREFEMNFGRESHRGESRFFRPSLKGISRRGLSSKRPK
jgi:hypothetical protein